VRVYDWHLPMLSANTPELSGRQLSAKPAVAFRSTPASGLVVDLLPRPADLTVGEPALELAARQPCSLNDAPVLVGKRHLEDVL